MRVRRRRAPEPITPPPPQAAPDAWERVNPYIGLMDLPPEAGGTPESVLAWAQVHRPDLVRSGGSAAARPQAP